MPFDMTPRPSLPGGDRPGLPEIRFENALRRKRGEAVWKPTKKSKPVPPPKAPRGRGRRVVRVARRKAPPRLRELVGELGFPSAAAYFRSPLWKAVRDRAFAELGRACLACGGPAVALHFSRPTRLNVAGKSVHGLHAVCRDCRRKSRLRPDGKKTTLAEANLYLFSCAKALSGRRGA